MRGRACIQAGGLLCEAASRGNVTAVRKLVDNMASPDSSDYDKRSALHLSSAEGHLDVVQFLLSAKADVNCKDRCVFVRARTRAYECARVRFHRNYVLVLVLRTYA